MSDVTEPAAQAPVAPNPPAEGAVDPAPSTPPDKTTPDRTPADQAAAVWRKRWILAGSAVAMVVVLALAAWGLRALLGSPGPIEVVDAHLTALRDGEQPAVKALWCSGLRERIDKELATTMPEEREALRGRVWTVAEDHNLHPFVGRTNDANETSVIATITGAGKAQDKQTYWLQREGDGWRICLGPELNPELR